jgi:TPP-dependent pyruvate/acetoin dehydrogenase alpha subunit
MMDRKSLCIELYRALYLIRTAESGILKDYHLDEMKTPMHMSRGEEAIVVGTCHALGKDAQVLGSYRSHALYLAKTGDTDSFFAEMYGKSTGNAHGKAGSMHLSAPEQGLLCSAAVVASTIPISLGVAFANKVRQMDRPTAVFFGDGATDTGVFWESLNGACLMKLPLMFVCEDNDFAVHTRKNERQGFGSIVKVAEQFDCGVFQSDSTDVEEIHRVAALALADMRRTGRPAFMHFKWHRYLEHVGINEDFDAGYRSKAEFAEWYENDPVDVQRSKILHEGWLEMDALEEMEAAIDWQVDQSIQLAKSAPLADPSEIYNGLFA